MSYRCRARDLAPLHEGADMLGRDAEHSGEVLLGDGAELTVGPLVVAHADKPAERFSAAVGVTALGQTKRQLHHQFLRGAHFRLRGRARERVRKMSPSSSSTVRP